MRDALVHPGDVFGRLTVVALEATKGGWWRPICDCACGASGKRVRAYDLLSGRVKSCGCQHFRPKPERRVQIDVGSRHGRLTCLAQTPCEQWQSNTTEYTFRCDCGKTVSIAARSVVSGKTRSCGCLRCTHNGTSKPGYRMWANARVRAAHDGLPFTISIDDVVIPAICPVLGIPLSQSTGRGPSDGSPTLDRFTPHLGYTPENIAVISQRANRIKNNATTQEILRVYEWMVAEDATRKSKE